MTLSQFIAEIKTSLRTYSRDINNSTIKLLVIQELKKLGVGICDINESVITIKDGIGKIDDDFKSLKLALKLSHSNTEIFGEENDLHNSYIYKERIENPMYFDEIQQKYVKTNCANRVTEIIHYGSSKAKFNYDYELLSLKKGIRSNSIDSSCLNMHPSIRNSYPNEISITNNTIKANFKEGLIYIKYYSLPKEDGELSIPEITTGHILDYLLIYVKSKVAEDLIANNLNPGALSNLYTVWIQEAERLRKLALTEAKFAGLDVDWAKKLKMLNRRDMNIFELPNLKFNGRR